MQPGFEVELGGWIMSQLSSLIEPEGQLSSGSFEHLSKVLEW
jgi:hypothetical protein